MLREESFPNTTKLVGQGNPENPENPEEIEKVKSIVKKAGDSIARCQPENNGSISSLSI
jgi:hypothetical protein